MSKLVVLTHNDLDALGSVICIERRLKVEKYFYTNYGDLQQQSNNVISFAKEKNIDTLLISDVSFSINTSVNVLKILCSNFKKVILIDHHMINKSEIDFKNLIFIHSELQSASKLCYNYLKIDDERISKLIDIIDTYDLWKTKSPLFKSSFIVNEYFFSIKKENDDILKIAKSILNGQNWLCNIKTFKHEFENRTENEIHSLNEKNLIFRNKKLKITIVFSFNSFNSLLLKEMDGGQDYVVGIHHGVVKFRINSDAKITDEFKLSLKKNLAGEEQYGHLNAFTYLNKNLKTNIDIINEVNKICKLIDK